MYTANSTAVDYYKLVSSSEGDDSKELSLRYVPAMGYSKPLVSGDCEKDGPVWAIHYVPGYLFWPPIPKRVCSRPCLSSRSEQCRPTCSKTRCIYRFVWRCFTLRRKPYYICRPYGWKRICYENHIACQCSCAYSSPYCYF